MRSLLARLAVLGAFAVTMSACSGGNGTSLPFAGSPNGAGGVSGTFQSGSNGQMLLRFIQGSPDTFSFFGGPPASTNVDVCVDNQPFGVAFGGGPVAYGNKLGLTLVAGGGITHTITVYPAQPPQLAGQECATAPGPYLGVTQIAIATLATPGSSNIRWTVVLAGTSASGTRGLYVYAEPTWFFQPTGIAVISHNAAPAFSVGKANGVGFGYCTTTVTPCAVATALVGAQGVAKPNVTGIAPATVTNGSVNSGGISTIPAGFYDGIGVPAGVPVPITSVVAPTAASGQPYVVTQYAIDGPAGGLNLVTFLETTLGFGF